MRILIVGLGSIGQRHFGILSKLPNVDLAAYRTSKGQKSFQGDLKCFYSINDALDFSPDGVIVANPTAMHVDAAKPFLEKGIKVLIEKPIDFNENKANGLAPFAQLLRVAYCMRFHELYKQLQSIFEKQKPFKVSFKRSFYLPFWHPYADYSKEYTARKDLGGGVIRTLSHEIDLALHWFGFPERVQGFVDKVSPLKMDADDMAFFSLKYASGLRVNFDLDFFSPYNQNVGEAHTSEGMYQWNLEQISFFDYKKSEETILFKSQPNALDKMYEEQMLDFIRFLLDEGSKNANFEYSIKILEIIKNLET